MEFDLSAGLMILERTPHTLRTMLTGLPSMWTDATEGPETWSPYTVVGHLVHGERTDWLARVELILQQGTQRRFATVDRLAQFRDSQGKSLDDLLTEFLQLRTENIARLVRWNLTDSQLALEGEHPVFGVVTLRQLLATWVAHDLAHTAQIVRVMAKQYQDAVGPWRAYLSIMDR